MKILKKFGRYLTRRKIRKLDVVMLLILLLGVFVYQRESAWYSVRPQSEITLVNPYLARSDGRGNTFVIDDERSRVVAVNDHGQVEYLLKSNTREADSFWYAEDLAFDEQGNTYLLDASWSESGSTVGRECILKYDRKGKYTDTLLDIVYEDEFVDKHKLFALTFRDNALFYVQSDAEGFSLSRLSLETGESERVGFYEYDNAFNLIQDYAVDAEHSVVYALDKRGKILKGADGELTVLYDTAEDPELMGKTALYRLDVDGQGRIYLTDIRQNIIYRFQEGDATLENYIDQGQVLSISTAETVEGNTVLGIWLDGSVWMHSADGQLQDDASEIRGDVFAKSSDYLLRETLFQISVLAAFAALLWLLIRLVVLLLGIRVSDVQKNGILAAGAAAVVAIVIVSQLLNQFADMYREELVGKLYILAHTLSGMVDGDSLGRIRTSEDYMNEDYQALMEQLEQGLNRQDPSVQEMYCNVLRYENGQGFAIAYQDNSIGTYYPREAGETQELAHIYETGEEVRNEVEDATGAYINVSVPVFDSDGKVAGVIEVGTTTYVITSSIAQMRRTVMITLVLVVLTVLFLFGEILSFFDQKARYRQKEAQRSKGSQPTVPLHLLRVSVFVTYMAFNVASSFLPVYAAGFVTDDLGIPRELAASLPITLNLIFIGITSVFCAPLMKRFSFQSVAAVSAGISMLGDITLLLGHSYILLVFGLILNGIGVGLITNSINMLIAGTSQEEVKQEGFSLFNAGSLSGINCGMMLGAYLAGVLGQRRVFGCSAAAWGVVLILFLIIGRHIKQLEQGQSVKKNHVGTFLVSRGVVPYMLLIQFPYIVINSFVFYYVPIYGDAHGFSESIVCLLLMLNSLCSVYLSVSVTNFMSSRFGMKSVYLSSMISFAALLLFGINSSVPMLIVVLLILGFSGSFGVAVRQTYFTKLEGVQKYGEEASMGIYNLTDNVGESAGPILFSSLMSGASILPGLAGFVAVSGAMNAIYAFVFRAKKKKK